MYVKHGSLCRLDAGARHRTCFRSVLAVCNLSQLLLPKSAENPSSDHDLSACQDRPSLQVTMLEKDWREVVVLEQVLEELCIVRSEA
jgi:hypothetical protein